MIWNWQMPEWPNFTWDRARMAAVEDQFLLRTGVVIGTTRHLQDADKQQLLV